MLLFILGVMRLFGLFPYRIDCLSETVTLSRPVLVYSLLLPATIWAVDVRVWFTWFSMIMTLESGTEIAVFLLMGLAYYVSIYLLPLHFLLRSRKLAKALSSLFKFHEEQLCHLAGNKLDKRAIFHLLLIVFSVICQLPTGIELDSGWVMTTMKVISILYDTPIRFLVPILHHAVFKLLSLMLAAAFVPLTRAIENLDREVFFNYSIAEQPSVETVLCKEDTVMGVLPRYARSQKHIISVSGNKNKGPEATKPFSRSAANNENTLGKVSVPLLLRPETDALLCARHGIILIEGVEATVSGVLAPLICVLLLSECILNVTVMMSIDVLEIRVLFYYIVYLVLAMVRSYLLLDAPEDYRSKVRPATGKNYSRSHNRCSHALVVSLVH